MIQVEHLTKTYRISRREGGLLQAIKALGRRETQSVRALDDISFHISDGEIVGYIGPNGAGKSSTIKILSGILVPDSGVCRVNGPRAVEGAQAARRRDPAWCSASARNFGGTCR